MSFVPIQTNYFNQSHNNNWHIEKKNLSYCRISFNFIFFRRYEFIPILSCWGKCMKLWLSPSNSGASMKYMALLRWTELMPGPAVGCNSDTPRPLRGCGEREQICDLWPLHSLPLCQLDLIGFYCSVTFLDGNLHGDCSLPWEVRYDQSVLRVSWTHNDILFEFPGHGCLQPSLIDTKFSNSLQVSQCSDCNTRCIKFSYHQIGQKEVSGKRV